MNLDLIPADQLEELGDATIASDNRHRDPVSLGPNKSVRLKLEDIFPFAAGDLFDGNNISSSDDPAVVFDERKYFGFIPESHFLLFSYFVSIIFRFALGRRNE